MTEIQTQNNSIEVRPFLRWAGGKRWLVDYLKSSILKDFNFNTYHEPFLGGGAMFFSYGNIKAGHLSDLNEELIFTYNILKNEPEKIIKELKNLKNEEDEYYKIRASNFRSDIKRAARFIYLNHFSYNGIYRVNLNGVYNVPYGFRKVQIDYENIRHASTKLSSANIISGDFAQIIQNVKKNDLVFLDPPYTVAHNNNGFIKYNQKIFSLDDQYRLAEIIQEIVRCKAYYILTNAAHEKIDSIFSTLGHKLIVSRNSLIGGHNSKRGLVDEYIFTNIIKTL